MRNKLIYDGFDNIGVLGRAPGHCRNKISIGRQVRQKSVPFWYHRSRQVSLLVPNLQWSLAPPALFKKGEEGRKKKEVLHLSRCFTHTHTHPAEPAEPGKPWKARGRKKRTHDGQTAKNSAGGEGNRRTSGTNLHGETDLTKTEHTPKPNDTLRRSQQEGD